MGDVAPPTTGPRIAGGSIAAPLSFLHESAILTSRTSEISRSVNDPPSVDDDGAPPTAPPPPAGGPHKVVPSGTNFDPLATPTDTTVPAMAETTSRGLLDDDASSSEDNIHEHSASSSMQVTPSKSKRLRFTRGTSTHSTTTSQTGSETSVLSCQLALLAALTAEMESSVNTLKKEQWKARICQINQVMKMVQWEANGLYGLGDDV